MYKVILATLLLSSAVFAADEFGCADGSDKCFVKKETHFVRHMYIKGSIADVGLACQKPIEDIKVKVSALNENLPDHDLNIQIKKYSWSYSREHIDNQGKATHVFCNFELHSENPKYVIETEAIHRDGWFNQEDGCQITTEEKNKVFTDSRSIYATATSGLGIALWNKCVVFKYLIKEKTNLQKEEELYKNKTDNINAG